MNYWIKLHLYKITLLITSYYKIFSILILKCDLPFKGCCAPHEQLMAHMHTHLFVPIYVLKHTHAFMERNGGGTGAIWWQWVNQHHSNCDSFTPAHRQQSSGTTSPVILQSQLGSHKGIQRKNCGCTHAPRGIFALATKPGFSAPHYVKPVGQHCRGAVSPGSALRA